MKENKYCLNTALAVVLGMILLIAVLVRSFAPAINIAQLDVPDMALISLAVLVLDHYLAPNAKRCYICIPVFSGITFGLLPFAACFVGIPEALKLALVGGIVFTTAAWLYTSIQDRLSSGPAAKAAPVISALGLYLAAQCLMGFL